MKVKDLLEELKNLDPEDDVFVQMNSGCCGETEEMTVYDIEAFKDCGLFIRCEALPGYKSCIQADGTIKRDKEYWDKDK